MYEQIASNKRKSMALFAGFFLIYLVIAFALYEASGPVGAMIILVIAAVMVGTTLYGGDDLAVRVAGGRQVMRKEEAPELWRMVENLAITAGLPMPRLFISSDPSPNAFAAGRSPEQAIVCVNQGLLEVLDDQELQGVLAHEMSHIRNYDVRLMTYAAVLAGSIAMIAQLLVYTGGGRDRGRDNNPLGIILLIATIILAPIAATIIQLSISRKREFVADASAADLTRYPQALASALQVISGSDVRPTHNEDAIAHMMIAPQMNARGDGAKRSLFSTHPPIEERVARLMEMAGGVPHQRGLPVSQTFHEALGQG
ncbi:MAG: M48 family metalloprotease [Solirubrobacteraceae bacterium]